MGNYAASRKFSVIIDRDPLVFNLTKDEGSYRIDCFRKHPGNSKVLIWFAYKNGFTALLEAEQYLKQEFMIDMFRANREHPLPDYFQKNKEPKVYSGGF